MAGQQTGGKDNCSQEVHAAYKECQRNHAVAFGGHAVDGCREFLEAAGDGNPKTFTCAACGCHLSFHRKVLKAEPPHHYAMNDEDSIVQQTRRRYTETEKKKMEEFAEKLGWRTVKDKVEEIDEFCNEMGFWKRKFQSWMSDHKPDGRYWKPRKDA